MNKRIEELAITARLSYVMTPDKPYIEEDLEKFAQLIITECAGYARDWTDMYVIEDKAPKQIDTMLKVAFGVS